MPQNIIIWNFCDDLSASLASAFTPLSDNHFVDNFRFSDHSESVSLKSYFYTLDKFSLDALFCVLYAKLFMYYYFHTKHSTIWTNCDLTLFTIVCHLNIMLRTLLFSFLILIHCFYQMLYITYKSFTLSKTAKGHHFSTMWTLRSLLLYPLA